MRKQMRVDMRWKNCHELETVQRTREEKADSAENKGSESTAS